MEPTRLWTMPEEAPPVLVATAGPVNAKRTGRHADGIITVGAPLEKIGGLFDRFAEGAREAGKDPEARPRVLQLHLSWAPTREEATTNAMHQWPNGGMAFPKADVRSPHDVAAMARLVRPEDFEGRMLISEDPDEHRAHIQRFADLGFDRIYSTGSTCTTSGATRRSGWRSSGATSRLTCTGRPVGVGAVGRRGGRGPQRSRRSSSSHASVRSRAVCRARSASSRVG
jgi:hypothetical protein